MINLQWGGHTNGQIASAALVDVSGKGDYLEATAAQQFLAMRAALHAATGHYIDPAPGSSAYRPLSIQQDFYRQRVAYLNGSGPFFPTAAYPGTSNHGWARAIDITGYEGSDARRGPSGATYKVNGTVWDWLIAHAAEFGYSWGTGDASGEAWHWESLTTPGTAVTAASSTATKIPLETIMAMKDTLEIFHSDRGYFVAGGGFYYPIGDKDGVGGSEKLATLQKIGVPTTELSVREYDVLNVVFAGDAHIAEVLAEIKANPAG